MQSKCAPVESTIASAQYRVSTDELVTLLSLARSRTLAQAALQCGVAASTVFRTVQRMEQGLGRRLFERSRAGYRPTELGEQLCRHALAIEEALQAAHGACALTDSEVSGVVRISAVDAVLHRFVVPALGSMLAAHPMLRVELQGSNALRSLTHRDADIALRSTDRPPEHLVGKRLGAMHFAVYAGRGLKRGQRGALSLPQLAAMPWIGIDEAMPDHPGVAWRKRMLPKVQPVLQVNSMVTAVQAIEAGLGVGVVALFHAAQRKALVQVSPTLDHCEIGLWLLTHPESRHLRRIAAVAGRIEQHSLSVGVDGQRDPPP
ncbi:LysR family transcriptional regulator [Aquabacterium humicola]|uniref:LysR family transcriptional regulator n=1 Tax=Aquabacterium humicola TaxID=3237377 RepID=UPI0025427BB0|nr:LysR family transcriptional regulator [Rubrivivax pictus]